MNKAKRIIVGFDLGGTKMYAAALDTSFHILVRHRVKTLAARGGENIYKRIVECIRRVLDAPELKGARLLGIGVGSPGPLDPDTGVIVDTPNLSWKNFPLGGRLKDAFKCPVAVDNDVNMGTYGEFHFGVAKGARNVIGIFPGTGIGGGLILDGQLFRGSTGNAGELGHVIVEPNGPLCGCGRRGCLEALASRVVVASQVAALAFRGDAPTIVKYAGTDIARIRSRMLAEAIANGDKRVEEVVRRAARYVGIAMGSFVNIFSPDMFVLGGGLVERLEDIFLEETERAMRQHSFPFLARNVKVKVARLGNDAVVMGAAKLIMERLQAKRRPRRK